MTAREGNMGNFHPSKTNVNRSFASVDICFLGVTISHVTFLSSQYLYNVVSSLYTHTYCSLFHPTRPDSLTLDHTATLRGYISHQNK